jgi:hypothetical protein
LESALRSSDEWQIGLSERLAAHKEPTASLSTILDCDNTLPDNLIENDFCDHLAREFGSASRDRCWAILEQLAK